MSAGRYAVKAPSRGGRREGAGRKSDTDVVALERRLARDGEVAEKKKSVDPVVAMAEVIGLSPRVAALRPDLTDRFETVPAGEHMARFARAFCRYTQLGEVAAGGPKLGDPYELEDFEREFDDEALVCDANGRRVFKRAGLIIPRKNRKTTGTSVRSLYFGSPADGEHNPLVVQAAGVKDQAAKLYDTTKAFIDDVNYGSRPLRALFLPSRTEIRCPSIGGVIKRVAGDGDNNHSLDPHVVAADELHTWKTPKQRENWKALTTAGGGRRDPFIIFISTEGDGDDNELAIMMERVEGSTSTEVEHRRPGLTVYRNLDAGLLIYRYALPPSATIHDQDAFQLANPAPWRTPERIAEDLADPLNDEPTKLRLYGNRRGGGAGRWISDAAWTACQVDDEIPDGAEIVVGVDGARTRDTTAVAWAYQREDGPVQVGCRVWSTRPETKHHVLVGGRLDNDLARDFIRDDLVARYQVRGLFYDERYFDDQADDLSNEDGLVVVEMHQGKQAMQAAWDGFYEAVYAGRVPGIVHDGDPVLGAHVKAAAGVKTERGWKVSKIRSARPIDALAAVVMALFGLGTDAAAGCGYEEAVVLCPSCEADITDVVADLCPSCLAWIDEE